MTSIHWKHLGLALALTAGLLGTAGATADSAAATASRSGAVVAPLQSGSCSGNLPLGTVVGMAATSDDGGYWIADASGDVVSCGDATNFGSLPVAPVRPIVGITATAAGGGFWLVASDGGIFAFGDAAFHGSTGALRLNRPVVGMAQDAATGGYWLVASDGGIFAFDAPFLGSTGAFSLNRPIVGMALSGGGSGYWLVASDGGIFAFDAPFLGSMGAVPLNEPVVGMAAGTSTGGYWLVAADGGIFAFGAPFLGSTGSITLSRPIVGMESSPSGAYRFVASDGGIFAFGDNFYGSAVAPPPPPAAVAGAGLRVGPGVQSTYTVQPQAAPGTCHYRYQGTYPLPDPGCTPGSISPQVTQSNIGSTICSSGYTSTIRPSSSITGPEKIGSKAAYSYSGSSYTVEYDHLVPLELGGDPNDPANLWAEPNDNPAATSFNNSKDKLENALNNMVCSGQMTLAAAQQAIAGNWATAYQQFG